MRFTIIAAGVNDVVTLRNLDINGFGTGIDGIRDEQAKLTFAVARHAMVECGAGVGMYCVDIAAQIPGLKRILSKEISLPLEVWLCAHDELKRSARMRVAEKT